MIELSQKTKSKNEKIVVNNLEVEEKSKENNQLQEKLDELSDNHSATTYHSQEVSDETDISESLKYSDFNSDDKDRKIFKLQSELEEIKKQLETFQNEPGENNCLNECCINSDYEDIKREKNDLENKNDSLNLLLNEKSPVGSRKSTDLPEWN
ncbi:4487_t:CDS:1 [Paraglomus occultum]|uniref:4487_t:CDS:1 n=1 Tax=Paraglomus occultum TaxID=144539 RepID=A0A9N9AZI0_9GLOM|nr:4487_t:CDS:1 [Paraglomus occultum]